MAKIECDSVAGALSLFVAVVLTLLGAAYAYGIARSPLRSPLRLRELSASAERMERRCASLVEGVQRYDHAAWNAASDTADVHLHELAEYAQGLRRCFALDFVNELRWCAQERDRECVHALVAFLPAMRNGGPLLTEVEDWADNVSFACGEVRSMARLHAHWLREPSGRSAERHALQLATVELDGCDHVIDRVELRRCYDERDYDCLAAIAGELAKSGERDQ